MKNNKKKILIYSILGIITVLIVTLTITYAYWILTRQQTGENVVNTACLNITFTGENDISLDKAYPMNEEQLESFLESATPYHFIIKNECNDLASASINLESLTVSGKALEDEYIDAILYEDDYNTNLNTNKKLTRPNDANKVITDAKHAYSLYNFTLKANEERDFNLLLYMNPDTPMEDTNMNASWKGKITLSTEYQEEDTTIRKIASSDTNGMWGYKDKLTKIIIENKKSAKTAEDGGKVYGPYDESEDGYGGVQSYVVCDTEETNCIGYLQGTNGIKGNEDSSYLFSGFTNVTAINGLENIDTSNVTNMTSMYNGMSNLISLDLSKWNTEKLSSISGFVNGCNTLTEINFSNWTFNDSITSAFTGVTNIYTCSSIEKLIFDNVDTSKVTNMGYMFINLEHVIELDLSDFDTTNVTNMQAMFFRSISLKSLDLSMWDTSHVTNVNGIFDQDSGLTELNISNWDLSNVIDSNSFGMLGDNSSLETIDMTNFVFPPNCYRFFANKLSVLSNLILTNSNTNQVTNMNEMFSGNTSLTTLDLSSWNTSNVENFNKMFNGAIGLQSITFGQKFIHKPEATTSGMFTNCSSLDRPTDESWQNVSFD